MTDSLIRDWKPATMCLIGISGRISKDVRAGDVVVATHVRDYLDNVGSQETAGGNWELVHAGTEFETTAKYVRQAMQLAGAGKIKFPSLELSVNDRQLLVDRDVTRAAPQVVYGPIAAGSVLSKSESFVAEVLKANRKLIAIDMESDGVISTLWESGCDAKRLFLRGISDFANSGKAELDKIGGGALRRYAARNAIGVFLAFAEAGYFTRRHEPLTLPGNEPAKRLTTRELQAYYAGLSTRLKGRLRTAKISNPDKDYIYRRVRYRQQFASGEVICPLKPIVDNGSSFILLGEAGAGKSTTVGVIASFFVTEAQTRRGQRNRATLLPVFLPVGDLVVALRSDWARLARPIGEAVRDWLRQFLIERLALPVCRTYGQRLGLAELKSLLQKDRLLLLVEGFDEIVAPVDSDAQSPSLTTEQFKRTFVDQLQRLLIDLGRTPAEEDRLVIGLSSRFTDADLLTPLSLPELSLVPIDDQDVETYVANWRKPLSLDAASILTLFREKLHSRPLYLYLLCRYLEGRPAAINGSSTIDELDLIRWEIEGNLNAVSVTGDEGGASRKICLRQLALIHESNGLLSRRDINSVALATAVPSRLNPDELSRALFVFLFDKGDDNNEFDFLHQNFRDFWLADGLCALLDRPDDTAAPDLAALDLAMKIPLVMEFAAKLLKARGSPSGPGCRRLLEEIRTAPTACPADRRVRPEVGRGNEPAAEGRRSFDARTDRFLRPMLSAPFRAALMFAGFQPVPGQPSGKRPSRGEPAPGKIDEREPG